MESMVDKTASTVNTLCPAIYQCMPHRITFTANNKKVQSAPYWVHGGDIRVRAEVETVSRWHQLILTPLCSPRTPALGRWKRKALMKMGSSPWSLPRSTIVGSTNVRA